MKASRGSLTIGIALFCCAALGLLRAPATLAASISIAGTVYTDEGITTMAAGKTISVSVNGAAAAGSTTTASDGTYTLSSINVSAGDTLTIYLDGNAERGVTVTVGNGLNLTGIDVYRSELIARCDNSCSLAGSNLNTSDNNADTDITAIYTTGSDTALTVKSSKSLYIPLGHTMAQGVVATTLSIGGNFTNRGTFLPGGNNTLTLTGTGSQTISPGGSSFNALTLSAGVGTYTLQSALTATGTVTLTTGTLDASVSNYGVTHGGTSWTGTHGKFLGRNGTVTFNRAAGNQSINASGSTFYNITHAAGGSFIVSTNNLSVNGALVNSAGVFNTGVKNMTVTGLTTVSGGTFGVGTLALLLNGGLTISGGTFTGSAAPVTTADFILSSGTLTIAGGLLTVSGNWTVSGGSFTQGSTSTVQFTGSGPHTITSNATSFKNVTLSGTGGTYVLQDALPATGNIALSAGILDVSANNYGITVGGSWWASHGRILTRSGSVTFNGSSTQTLNGSGTTFYDLVHAGNVGTLLQLSVTPLTVTHRLTNTSGIFSLNNINLITTNATISNSSTIQLTGFETLTGFVNDAVHGTILYYGTIAFTGLAAGNTYNNLTFSANTSAGVWTLNHDLTMSGSLSLQYGTVDASLSNYAVTVGGDWNALHGHFISRNGSVTFNRSSGVQNLDGSGAALSAMIHNGSGTLKLSTDPLTVTGSLSNSAGTFDLNGLSLTTNGAIISNTSTIQLRGSETLTGFINDSTHGTVLYTGTGTYAGLAAGNAYNHLSFSGSGAVWSLGHDVTVNGTLRLLRGTLDASIGNYAVSVAGDFLNGAIFTARSGLVTLSGTNQTLSGSTVFYDLTKTVTAAATLTVTAATTQTIAHALVLAGTAGQLLSLRSSLPGIPWSLDPQGTRAVSFADVSDSNNISMVAIDCTSGCIDSGNNVLWTFAAASSSSSSSSSAADTGGGTVSTGGGGGGGGGRRGVIPSLRSGQTQGSSSQASSSAASSMASSTAHRHMTVRLPDGTLLTFSDVWTDDWFAGPVKTLVETGVLSGYADPLGRPLGLFGPADGITYGQLAKIALLAAHQEVTGATTGDDWALPYLAAALRLRFSVYLPSPNPMSNATRGQMIQTLLEALKIPLEDGPLPYADVPANSPHAQAIATATRLKIVSGYGDGSGRFGPDTPVNRAEAAKMFVLGLAAAKD